MVRAEFVRGTPWGTAAPPAPALEESASAVLLRETNALLEQCHSQCDDLRGETEAGLRTTINESTQATQQLEQVMHELGCEEEVALEAMAKLEKYLEAAHGTFTSSNDVGELWKTRPKRHRVAVPAEVEMQSKEALQSTMQVGQHINCMQDHLATLGALRTKLEKDVMGKAADMIHIHI